MNATNAPAPVASPSAASLADLFQPGKRWEYKLTQNSSGALITGTYAIEVKDAQEGAAHLKLTTAVDGASPVSSMATVDTTSNQPFSGLGQSSTAVVSVVNTLNESVTVPAGTYQTTHTTYHEGDAYGESTIEQWVAPEVGLVRQQLRTQLSLGDGPGQALSGTTVIELTAVH